MKIEYKNHTIDTIKTLDGIKYRVEGESTYICKSMRMAMQLVNELCEICGDEMGANCNNANCVPREALDGQL